MRELGYGNNYQYAHEYEGNFSDQEFLPDKVKGRQIYQPGNNSRENDVRRWLKEKWKNKYGYWMVNGEWWMVNGEWWIVNGDLSISNSVLLLIPYFLYLTPSYSLLLIPYLLSLTTYPFLPLPYSNCAIAALQ